ncbi:hypothetical protein [Amycolatopsis sp. H20-H5]|uniref:hypothetical protein n=1 Tax=Amycolatopsis sp. H20-H5 TaxID=3046309 RepID=UPI002DBE19B6|nr:hypothetical protein [Amycolatopsis sp. H20-H5]MEC3980062.1 hypothetical protein [Amycolatopsis sp. H20-H5]
MTGTRRPRRIASIDRPWTVQKSLVLATPLAVKPVDEIRAVLTEHARRHPGSPITSRLDPASCRWLPVPLGEWEAHLDRMVVTAADPDPGDLDGHISAHVVVPADLPLVVVVSPTSMLAQTNHAVGDAITLTQLVVALSRADQAQLDAVEQRARTAEPVWALLRGLRPHHRDWAQYVRHRTAPPTPSATGPAVTLRPSFAGSVLSNTALRDITRWRNANARGVSLTSVLTSLAHQAFLRRDMPVHDQGFYTLLDLRPLLPASTGPRWGNLSKSLYLTADLTDPRAVEVALKAARKTRRALPATVVAAATGAVSRPRPPDATSPTTTPMVLTFNSIPTLPGLSELPWNETGQRRYYGFGPAVGSGGITVFAIRLREHMELTASFDETAVSADTVREALEAMSDPAVLLTGLATTPAPPATKPQQASDPR